MRTQHLAPRRLGVEIIGASSDHLVLDVEEAHPAVQVGESLDFVASTAPSPRRGPTASSDAF